MSITPGASEQEILARLQAAREHVWRLRFEPALESEFRRQGAMDSTTYIRRTLPWLTLMYALVLAAIALGVDDNIATRWRNEALLPAGLSLVMLWAALPFRALGRHLALIMGLAMAGALVLMTRGVFLVDQTALGRPVSYCVVYVLLIIFALSRLRLRQALALTGGALAIVLLLAATGDLQPDWLAFVFYFPMTAILCAVICYMIEFRERSEFLASQILSIEKTRLEQMRESVARDARRQQAIGQYFKQVAGNPTPTEIAGRTLAFLVEHTGAQVGVVFLASGERLRRAAAWGLQGETRSPEDLGLGETLLGQAARDRRRLRQDHLPPGYHVIRTGIGEMSPAELLVEPVCSEEDTLAVIELGALARFDDDAVDLVAQVARTMAGALVAAQARDALARAGIDDFTP